MKSDVCLLCEESKLTDVAGSAMGRSSPIPNMWEWYNCKKRKLGLIPPWIASFPLPDKTGGHFTDFSKMTDEGRLLLTGDDDENAWAPSSGILVKLRPRLFCDETSSPEGRDDSWLMHIFSAVSATLLLSDVFVESMVLQLRCFVSRLRGDIFVKFAARLYASWSSQLAWPSNNFCSSTGDKSGKDRHFLSDWEGSSCRETMVGIKDNICQILYYP